MPRPPLPLPVALLAALCVAACAPRDGGPEPQVTELSTPTGAGSAQPNLAAAEGTVVLSWLEPRADGAHVLRVATWGGEAWGEPREVAAGADFFVNWADFPSALPLPGGGMAAHWLQRSGPGTYAYDVRIAHSADGGRSWGAPVTPHRDGTQTEHGFVSLFPGAGGGVGAVWLDGRNFEGHAEGEAHGTPGPEMTLRHAVVGPDGSLLEERLLDPRVCDCCQTSAALTAEGPVVVYRDRSPGEVRDIAIVRRVGGEWSAPATVHPDGWEIAGCPVNGPAVAAEGRRVAVAWFTAASDTPRVRVAFSEDAGASFGAPVEVHDADPLGRVDVLLLEGGDALVVWLERTDEEAEIRMRRVGAGRERGRSWTLARTGAARASGFPRMARAGEAVLLAWTDPGEPSRVRTALVRFR